MSATPSRFWLAGGEIWQRTDAGSEVLTPDAALVLAQELEIGERECRRYEAPIITAIADMFATWRRELAAVWREYLAGGAA